MTSEGRIESIRTRLLNLSRRRGERRLRSHRPRCLHSRGITGALRRTDRRNRRPRPHPPLCAGGGFSREAPHRSGRRAPRRAVRHDHRHDRYDDVRRGRAIVRGVTTVAVGTRVRRLPTSCTTVITRNVTYRHCEGAYYRPYYEGTTVVYVVVEEP